MLTQSRSRKKVSGGTKKLHRKKKLYEKANLPALTKIGKKYVRTNRIRSGKEKLRIIRTEDANVYDPKSKQFKKAKIKTVEENKANRHYARANIMTKGAIINTDMGKARITNRPGQEGTINAVLI